MLVCVFIYVYLGQHYAKVDKVWVAEKKEERRRETVWNEVMRGRG